jgi:hypothetical protein
MTTTKSAFLTGSAGLLATAAAAATAAPTRADVMHSVRYTVTADNPIYANIYYLDQQPSNFGVYSHNPYQFMPNVQADIAPGKPWTQDVTLTDPENYAVVTASTGTEPGTPNFHCTLTVDGAVVATKDGPKGVLCSLRSW